MAERLLRSNPQAIIAGHGGLDPDVVEAAALAHDLGHPPFGHIGERVLDESVIEARVSDGFEGNAQTFRIVTKLAIYRPDTLGLNLTRATLNALLKYPWLRAEDGKKSKKYGAYRTEKRELAWARELCKSADSRMCLEAALMEWADDVAYSVYDVEDFYRAGKIPLDRLVNSEAERKRFLDEVFAHWKSEGIEKDEDHHRKALNNLQSLLFPIAPFTGTRKERGDLRHRTGTLVARFVSSLTLNPKLDDHRKVIVAENILAEMSILKELTRHYVINDESLNAQNHGHSCVVKGLFEIFSEACKKTKTWSVFPLTYRDQLRDSSESNEDKIRIVVDLISGMTEQQAIEMYQRFKGISLGSMFHKIV
jgi:dGTPase